MQIGSIDAASSEAFKSGLHVDASECLITGTPLAIASWLRVSTTLTDPNFTDMETCYKVFSREVIQSIQIEESRFGFEPEVVAKIAHKRGLHARGALLVGGALTKGARRLASARDDARRTAS